MTVWSRRGRWPGVRRGMVRGPGTASFLPSDLANLGLWLDASDPTTLFTDAARTTPVTADADPVGGWADKSGNDNHTSQSTAGFRPLYRTNLQNGLPGVSFDGTDDFLVTDMTGSAAKTIIMVGRAITDGDSDAGRFWNISFFANAGIAFYFGTLVWLFDEALTAVDLVHDPSAAAFLSTVLINSNSNAISFINGTQTATFDPDDGVTADYLYVGAGATGTSPIDGWIGELIVYNRALTTDERLAIEDYLWNKYALV